MERAPICPRPTRRASDNDDGSGRLLRLYDALLERQRARTWREYASSSSVRKASHAQTEAEGAVARVPAEAESANSSTPLVPSLLSVLSGESHDEVKAQVAGLLFAGLEFGQGAARDA